MSASVENQISWLIMTSIYFLLSSVWVSIEQLTAKTHIIHSFVYFCVALFLCMLPMYRILCISVSCVLLFWDEGWRTKSLSDTLCCQEVDRKKKDASSFYWSIVCVMSGHVHWPEEVMWSSGAGKCSALTASLVRVWNTDILTGEKADKWVQ